MSSSSDKILGHYSYFLFLSVLVIFTFSVNFSLTLGLSSSLYFRSSVSRRLSHACFVGCTRFLHPSFSFRYHETNANQIKDARFVLHFTASRKMKRFGRLPEESFSCQPHIRVNRSACRGRNGKYLACVLGRWFVWVLHLFVCHYGRGTLVCWRKKRLTGKRYLRGEL